MEEQVEKVKCCLSNLENEISRLCSGGIKSVRDIRRECDEIDKLTAEASGMFITLLEAIDLSSEEQKRVYQELFDRYSKING
jgi:hypothetical protein